MAMGTRAWLRRWWPLLVAGGLAVGLGVWAVLTVAALRTLPVTVPAGAVVSEVVDTLAVQTGIPVEEFTTAIAEEDLGLPEWAVGLEGHLAAGTIEVPVGAGAGAVLRQLVAVTQQRLAEVEPDPAAHAQLLIVASLVQQEIGSTEDAPHVAAVIVNRYRSNDSLLLDSTARYVARDYGLLGDPTSTIDQWRKLRHANSTHNIARYPDSPIGSVNLAVLQATVDPLDTPDRYFVMVDPVAGRLEYASTAVEYEQLMIQRQHWCIEQVQQGQPLHWRCDAVAEPGS